MAEEKKQEEVLTGTQGPRAVAQGVGNLIEAVAGEIKRGVTEGPGKQVDSRAPSQRLNLFAEGVGKMVQTVVGTISYGVKKAVTDPFGNSREDSLTASRHAALLADGLNTMARAVTADHKAAPPRPSLKMDSNQVPPPQASGQNHQQSRGGH